MELSEGIASMNYREFMRNNPKSEVVKGGCENSILCSYPSNDNLMNLFLLQFERNKERYESNMLRHTGKILSCDHTFKTSKHIGVTRDDGKFVRQFQNVFLGVNENGEVLTWRFTKSTSSTEIVDALNELKDRLSEAGNTLDLIVVDDCCHVRNLYEQIFPGVRIRLDLFHACMRIIQTISKGEDFSKQFSNEFSLIFRRNGDLGEERTMDTPCPEEIEANLERLLFVWRKKIPKETVFQIENLRKHIQKGCLSDIPPGCGTEMNERLHRHLNRSLLCGVSKIGPELAVAVMTCVLYAWNCKRKGKHLHNKRTVPVPPIEIESSGEVMSSSQHHIKPGKKTPASPLLSTVQTVSIASAEERGALPRAPTIIGSANCIGELKTDAVLHYILRRMLQIQEFYYCFTKKCENKTFDLIALLWSVKASTVDFSEQESSYSDLMEFDLTPQHRDDLLRNLSGFNLELDGIPKDGNCFFRATVRQLKKYLQSNKEQLIEQHISSLGLGNSEENDTKKLRLLFVQELTENIHNYREWMSSASIMPEIERFKTDGYFASEIGDICAKACSNLLRIPIVLITALPSVPSIPFLPKDFVCTIPMYIAYNHSGPGHYDATKGISILIIHQIFSLRRD